MATKAEQAHAEVQRRGPAGGRRKLRPGRGKPGTSPRDRSRASKRVAKKATYAFEGGGGRPSRRSTRKSANRAKPDASLNLTEQLVKGSPEARFRRAKAWGETR